eukprot:Nk52_evm15s48 gene=Nk52_evmTU15s48
MKLSCISFCLIAALLVVLMTVQCSAQGGQVTPVPTQTDANSQAGNTNSKPHTSPLATIQSADVFIAVDCLSDLIWGIVDAVSSRKSSKDGGALHAVSLLLESTSFLLPILFVIAKVFQSSKALSPVYHFFKDTLGMNSSSIPYAFAAGMKTLTSIFVHRPLKGAMSILLQLVPALVYMTPFILGIVNTHVAKDTIPDWSLDIAAFASPIILPFLIQVFTHSLYGRMFQTTYAVFTIMYLAVTIAGRVAIDAIRNFQQDYHLEFSNAVATFGGVAAIINDLTTTKAEGWNTIKVQGWKRLYKQDAEAIPTVVMQALSYTPLTQ